MTRRQALGQHFLTRHAILEKIIAVIAPREDDLIVEIGPGRGALTFPLAERCARLIAVEIDPALIPGLREKEGDKIEIREGDILRTDLREIVRREAGRAKTLKLVGNLPYSISSPLLFKILDETDVIAACVFLLQKEVAERIAAGPGSKKFSPLSILLQIDFEVRLRFAVAPGAFSPPPRVWSALVSLKKRVAPLYAIGDQARFRRFLRTAFGQRRKTFLNNMKTLAVPVETIKQALNQVSLDEHTRSEQMTIGQLVELFELLPARG